MQVNREPAINKPIKKINEAATIVGKLSMQKKNRDFEFD